MRTAGQPKVWVSDIRIRGYKSCLTTSFKPNKNLSVLIGPNGAGKTNILQALRLLATGQEEPYRRAYTSLTHCLVQVHFWVGRKLGGLRSELSYFADEDGKEILARAGQVWNFDSTDSNTKLLGNGWQPYPEELYLRDAKYWRSVPHLRRVKHIEEQLWRETNRARRSTLTAALKLIRSFNNFATTVRYYSASQFTNPLRCPSSFDYEGSKNRYLPNSRKRDHVRLLMDMYDAWKRKSPTYDAYLSVVGKGGLGLVSKISWREVLVASSDVEVRSGGKVEKKRRQKLLVVPTVTIGGNHLYFNQLSEGTFRTLALVFYLLTDGSDLLLIEEPEVCIHHGLLNSIVELLKDTARTKQIIVSTHSEFVLDSVALDDVFAVARDKEKGTTVKSLSKSGAKKDIDAIRSYLCEEGSLGELWKHGGLDL